MKKVYLLIMFSLFYLIVNAQISNIKFSSDFDGKIYEFDVYCLGLINNEYKNTIKLKILKTLYEPPEQNASGLIRFTCWDYYRQKEIKIYFNNEDNYFRGSGLNDYGCNLGCYWRNDKISNYLRKAYNF